MRHGAAKETPMHATTLGIDLGKRWFHVVGLDATGRVVRRDKLTRTQLHELLATHPPCLIGMETCCGAQHFGRLAAGHGHDVRLIPAQHVRPFVKAQKNDFNDAAAIAEVVRLPSMRPVPLRSLEQIDVQALHRARQRLIQQRTGMTNQIRGLLLDRGLPIPQGLYPLRTAVPQLLEDAENALTPVFRSLLSRLLAMWRQTEAAIEELTDEIQAVARESDRCRRLQSIPGVGPLVATALVSAVGNASAFRSSRDLAAWVGLVPRQHTTGGKPKLLGISKRGNSHLRRLFVQGARALWVWKDKRDDPLHRWMRQLAERMHPHKAVCAVANKLVRICWALLRHDEVTFQHAAAAA
jgi:transposase